LTWEYLAGFFDGEGCLNTGSGSSRRSTGFSRIFLAQSGPQGLAVLREIQDFLEQYAIQSSLLTRPKVKAHHEAAHILTIGRRDSLLAFLTAIRGHVRVKKQVVEDTRRFLLIYPSTRRASMLMTARAKRVA
jgi:intein/homing endonuclease